MTSADTSGRWSLAHISFTAWSQAAAAPQTFLDTNPDIGNRNVAAPQVFYFAPQEKWYMAHQTGPLSFSTTNDPANPGSWGAPRNLFDAEPPIVTENDLFEGSNAYRPGSSGKYLMLVEAPATGSGRRRHFRAWTAGSLCAAWKPPAETEADPFIRSTHVTFGPGQPAWTTDFSHGEMTPNSPGGSAC
ncbi:non-reducing end alpha-L-arabinofuranosidase family hydrolase [Streptomyces sp. R28]|uniref:non-reducing end alpha-L-arabinofuranosidase n=1 Tax=Streptomyces sp. R28 TaxID=3238628 RepID=A0AB39PQN9_9ACTN